MCEVVFTEKFSGEVIGIGYVAENDFLVDTKENGKTLFEGKISLVPVKLGDMVKITLTHKVEIIEREEK